MPRFVLIGSASTETIINAPDAKTAAEEWGAFQKQHQKGRRGPMTVRLLYDPPIIIDTDGRQCEVDGVTSKRNRPCQVHSTASS